MTRLLAGTAVILAVLNLCACASIGLADGDPGRAVAPPPRLASETAPAPAAQASSTSSGAAPAPAPAAAAPGSAAAQPAPPPAPAAPAADGGAFSAVTVTFTDEMQQLAAADPRLTPDDVAAAVERELAAHHLYDPAAAGLHRTLAISIANYTNSLSSNASVLGFTFRSVALTGDVQVKGDPAMAGTFDVHARARLTTRDSGASAGALGGLYTRFAVLTVSALRGVAAPQEPVPR